MAATKVDFTTGISKTNGISPKQAADPLVNKHCKSHRNGENNILEESIFDRLKAGLNGQTKNLLESMASATTCPKPDTDKGDTVSDRDKSLTNGERKRPADVDIAEMNPTKLAKVDMMETSSKNDEIIKTVAVEESSKLITSSDSNSESNGNSSPLEKGTIELSEEPDSSEQNNTVEKSCSRKEVDKKDNCTDDREILSIAVKMRDYTKDLIQAALNSVGNSTAISQNSSLPPDRESHAIPSSNNRYADKGNLFENLSNLTCDIDLKTATLPTLETKDPKSIDTSKLHSDGNPHKNCKLNINDKLVTLSLNKPQEADKKCTSQLPELSKKENNILTVSSSTSSSSKDEVHDELKSLNSTQNEGVLENSSVDITEELQSNTSNGNMEEINTSNESLVTKKTVQNDIAEENENHHDENPDENEIKEDNSENECSSNFNVIESVSKVTNEVEKECIKTHVKEGNEIKSVGDIGERNDNIALGKNDNTGEHSEKGDNDILVENKDGDVILLENSDNEQIHNSSVEGENTLDECDSNQDFENQDNKKESMLNIQVCNKDLSDSIIENEMTNHEHEDQKTEPEEVNSEPKIVPEKISESTKLVHDVEIESDKSTESANDITSTSNVKVQKENHLDAPENTKESTEAKTQSITTDTESIKLDFIEMKEDDSKDCDSNLIPDLNENDDPGKSEENTTAISTKFKNNEKSESKADLDETKPDILTEKTESKPESNDLKEENTDSKPSLPSKKRAMTESESEDNSHHKKSRLDSVIGQLGDRIGVSPSDLSTKETDSEVEPTNNDDVIDKVEINDTAESDDESEKIITLTSKELEKLIEERIHKYLQSEKDSLVIRMKKKMEDLQTAIEVWKTQSKELQKQMFDIQAKQHQRGDRRRSALKVVQRNMGIQVDDKKFEAVQLKKDQANHPNLTVRMSPHKGQHKSPDASAGNATPIQTGSVNTQHGSLNPNQANRGLSQTPMKGGVTVRNLLDIQRKAPPSGKVMNAPAGGQVATGQSTRSAMAKPGTVNALATKPVKGVIDLTDDDDHRSPPKTGSGTALKSVPASQVGQIVCPGVPCVSTDNIRPGTMVLQQPVSGGTPVVLQQVMHNQPIRSQGATYVLNSGSRPGTMMVQTASGTPSMVRQAVVAGQTGIRPGQQIVFQPRSGTPATGARPPPPLQSAPAQANQAKHPAPLPPIPTLPNANNFPSLPPPKPGLKISRVQQGIVLSWNMTINNKHADIVNYQLFAYQVGSAPPSSSLWKKVGDVKALPLPMACTLTQFQEGNKYHFAVRAVDTHGRIGQFSDPSSIHLLPSSSSS